MWFGQSDLASFVDTKVNYRIIVHAKMDITALLSIELGKVLANIIAIYKQFKTPMKSPIQVETNSTRDSSFGNCFRIGSHRKGQV